MPICFVMQPFDGGKFDSRYEDIFEPAIRAAGLEPYRVDKDPKASIPIHEIETGIRESQLCLAEITQDNPNVWFELGYAIACGKEVVLVCSDERTSKFPFDIQHRTIIKYSSTAPRDFERLKQAVSEKIRAYLQKAKTLASASAISKVTKFEGLEQHEVMCLAVITENLESPAGHASAYILQRDMENSGFTRMATNLAIRSLASKKLITYEQLHDDYSGENYFGYWLTDDGWDWALSNKDMFVLNKPAAEDLPF